MLVFESPSCTICKVLSKEVLQDTSLSSYFNQNFIVRIVSSSIRGNDTANIYEDTPDGHIAEQFNISGFPVIVILKGLSQNKYEVLLTLTGFKTVRDTSKALLIKIEDQKAHFDKQYALNLFEKYKKY
jgi:thioredoxin-related protein